MLTSEHITILQSSTERVMSRIDLSGLFGKSLFITGGTGFFGLWLLTALQCLNRTNGQIQVCVLSRDPSHFLSRYPHFANQAWLKFVTGDIRNFRVDTRPFDFLIHAATETSLAAHNNPITMFENIVFGTRRVMEMAHQCGTSRMLLISSGAVYGSQPANMSHQPDDSLLACDPLRSANAYGEGKRVMELMGSIMQDQYKIEAVVARCFSFSGPGLPLDGHYAFGNFIRDALFEPAIHIEGDGSPVRSYLYGADLAIWLLRLLVAGKAGQSYNVGSDQAIDIKDLAYRIRDLLEPGKPVTISARDTTLNSDRRRYVPEIRKARSLGCEPWTTLDESIRLTARYWKNLG